MVIGAARTGHRQPWDAAADADLVGLLGQGMLLREIAITLGRTQEAVRSRANVLKLPVRSSVRAHRTGFTEDGAR